jgi:hypothetical protein
MEQVKINSKTGYNRNRVMNGQGPHKMLKMVQKKMFAKLAKEETKEAIK